MTIKGITFPEDWEIRKIGDLTETTAGGTPSTLNEDFWGGDIKWMSSGELHTKRIYDVEGRITKNGLLNSSTKILPKDSVLIGLAGQGKTRGTVAMNMVELCTNQSIAAILPCSEIIPDYLFYNLDSRYHELRNRSTGASGRGGLNLRIINALPLPIPPLEEQRAIAEVLSDVDALIEAQEALIAKKRLIKQGVMQELLTGKRRLPGYTKEWEQIQLKNIVNDFIVPMRDKPKEFTGDIPWCRIEDFDGKYLYKSKSNQNVNGQIVEEMKLRVYPQGTLLVSCSANLGKCAIVGRPLVSNQTFIGLVFDKELASNEFFFYYMILHAEELNNLSSGTTISYLSREQFEEFFVCVPVNKNEQEKIAKIIGDIDSEIKSLADYLEKIKKIKQGMMQELLTGRTRLV